MKDWDNKTTKTLAVIISITLYACAVIWAYFTAKSFTIDLPTYHLDGNFQTASGLFRLANGELPGRDFFPYLGIGPVFLLFPLFAINGSDFAASIFASHFATLLLSGAAASLVLHLLYKPRSALYSLAAGTSIFFLTLYLAQRLHLPGIPSFAFAANPGHSLRPVRAIAPYFLTLIFLLGARKSLAHQIWLSALACGIASLWSNDYAIPSVFLYLVFFLNELRLRKQLTRQTAAATIGLTIFSCAALLTAATAGHPIAMLKYNFLDVARDQWWYFQPYAADHRIFSPRDFLHILDANNARALVALGVIAVLAIRGGTLQERAMLLLGTGLFSGGLLASVGGHFGGYFSSFVFWGDVTLVFALPKITALALKSVGSPERLPSSAKAPSMPALLATGMLACATCVAAVDSGQAYHDTLSSTSKDPREFFIPELGGYLTADWKPYIDFIRANPNARVIEEYWGIWSAFRHIFPPWPVDAVIHALGDVRGLAASRVPSADFVVTTRYAASPAWVPWNISENFWLYRQLLSNWTPVSYSPLTVVWRKSDARPDGDAALCQPGSNHSSFAITAPDRGFYAVTLQYFFKGSRRSLLVLDNKMQPFVALPRGVSLPPRSGIAEFPVYLSKPGKNSIPIKATSIESYSLNVSSCQTKRITFNNSEVLHDPEKTDANFFITDGNWINGIARHWGGFFVPNTRKSNEIYRPGRMISLPDGKRRMITRVHQNGMYLNVFTSGGIIPAGSISSPLEIGINSK